MEIKENGQVKGCGCLTGCLIWFGYIVIIYLLFMTDPATTWGEGSFIMKNASFLFYLLLILGVFFTASIVQKNIRKNQLRMKLESEELEKRRKHLRKYGPAPRLIRVWRDAEQAACDWMRYFGFEDAQLTGLGADGGIDVSASEAIAQVKFEGVKTQLKTVQRHHGVAHGEGKLGLFFSLGGYTNEAVSWANKVNMPLFTFDLQGKPECINKDNIEITFNL